MLIALITEERIKTAVSIRIKREGVITEVVNITRTLV